MKRVMRASFAVCVLCLAVSSAQAWQAMPQPFSSDLAVTPKSGEKVTGKFYFSPPKTRMDMTARGHDMSVISDSSTQVGYVLMHQQHMYMETHAGQAGPMTASLPKFETSFDASNPCAGRADLTCKKVGTESVNGRSCDKWEFTDKKNGTSTVWVDQKLNFPIRSQNADGSAVDFTNIKEGAPSASLFAIPDGYRKIDLGGMMGRRPPQ